MTQAQGSHPAHARLSSWLRCQMEAGALQPGDRLPSEHELAAQHGVSRTTVRRALQSLQTASLIHRRRGSGTFVSSLPLQQGLGDLRSFTKVISDLGLVPGIRDIVIEVDPDPPADARAFLLTSPLRMIRRVRLADGEVFSVSYSWVSDATGRKLDGAALERKQSLYRVLEEDCRITIARARETIRAEPAQLSDAQLLGVAEGAPVIVIYRWAEDRSGGPVEFARAASPWNRHEYTVTLVRT